ncbi:uncharacterized protein VTP21DRAFT_4448 [Calcarisporiella thermophila]|uniref:uncharacterized protein n=1 Tax=Calcarisporiella thermophila TaxID=911321 RepID=UPI003743FCAC
MSCDIDCRPLVKPCSLAKRQLPDSLLNFASEHIWGLIKSYSPKREERRGRYSKREPVILPEFMFYMHRINSRGGISPLIMILAMIYVFRIKKRLLPNGVGGYGFCHKIFTACILIACKFLHGGHGAGEWGEEWQDLRRLDHGKTSHLPLTSRAMSKLGGYVFSCSEINLMERVLLQLLNFDVLVRPDEIVTFLQEHRKDLCAP